MTPFCPKNGDKMGTGLGSIYLILKVFVFFEKTVFGDKMGTLGDKLGDLRYRNY